MNYNIIIIVHLLLFSFCLCEISVEQKEKLLNGFIDYYNKLPNQIYMCNEGTLQNTQQVDETTYQIEATLKVTELHKVDVTKLLKCTATVQDLDNGITVTNNHCQEHGQPNAAETGSQEQVPEAQVEVSEPTVERSPVQLDNEVQSETAITSGEQFIAIPRDQPSAPCIGCATHVNPQAAGVSDLANLGVRHLDIHEPTVKHSLDSVLDVERQVQVVNGVRYILILSINFNNCSKEESENCASSKTCKITILAKPWVKLPNGANYRAILGNNCTEEWQYGDNGEVLPELSTDNRVTNNKKGNTSVEHDDANASDYDIRVKHNKDVQSQPHQERSLTDEEIKTLQEQIIPNGQFLPIIKPDRESATRSPDMIDVSKQHVFKVESGKHSENSIPVTESENIEHQTLNIHSDKKKAIDELLDFFDFSGFKPKSVEKKAIPRIKRSYDYDLQVLSLTEDFHDIKKSIENAKFVYEMAQAMVDYLNEMDIEVKTRAVKNVIKAEEELENLQRFVYIQARVTIPCDKVECEPKDTITQICNGVIDSTNKDSPQILNTFCYNDNKERDYRDVVKDASLDDPVLQNMAKEAVKKIESESTSPFALKINKIVSANTQTTSGTLSKISLIIEYINCNKSVILPLRMNCTVMEELGSKICEIIIHERHWLKEKKLSYTCTDRPVDIRISKNKSILKNITENDPKIIDMLQEAIQYLETQSNKNYKQKIVNVKSISSEIIAGFLTKIEFVVGYTNCTDGSYPTDQLDKCELLKNYGLRICKAQIWDRSWIMDGRQVEVSCDDVATSNEIENTRKKRSMVGDPMDQSVNNRDLKYKKLAYESLKKFLKSSSSRQHYEVVKVDRVDVVGKLIKMDFTISPSNCLIQSDGRPSSSKCNVFDSKIIYRCHSKILEHFWLDKKQFSVNCNIKDQKQNRKTNLNGLKEQIPSESKYYQLAEESLKKYLRDTGNSPHYRIVKVEKVTTQIVSGLLTSIDFIISSKNKTDSGSNTISCHSKILEKHWLGTKDFNVSCEMIEKYNLTENPDNPKYMQIAVESLQKYIKNNPDSHLVRVTFVEKVAQVGEIIELDFVASRAEDDNGDSICHAEFSEQGLLRNDIDVKCHLIGTVFKTEITEEDPNHLKYVQLAHESLHNYLQSINSSQLYTIINIYNVTVQWDKGIKIVIDFIVSPVDLDNNEMQEKRCHSQVLEQPWLNKKHFDVNCEVDKDLYRTKRQIFKRESIAVAQHEKDPNNHEYKALAEESLQKYIHDSGTQEALKVVRVEKVTTQVVAGTLTRIDFVVSGSPESNTIKCHSEVWEQSWLNKKDINVSCQNDNQRVKRQVLGGQTTQAATDPKYKALAEESLLKYVHDSGTQQNLKVVQVEKVTTQVVAGSLTRIDFVVSGSPESNTIKCHSAVWERPWLDKKDINVSCQNDNQRVKRHLTGGETTQSPTDPEYKVLAEESLQKYIHDSGTQQALKVVRVEKVTTQVVAGTLTRIDFVVSSSPELNTIKCHSEVWEQSWLEKKDIEVSCQNDNQRVKRHLTGGETTQSPTDPEYKALAEESLLKYVHDSGTQQNLKVVQVEKVTTQVVAGTLTRIDFVVSGSPESNTIKCHSEVWEQSWLEKKDIEVSCQNDNQRVKRYLTGGETTQSPTDPEYKALAEESLQKYIHDSGTQQTLKVVRVEKVTTQVVAGTLTRIDFVVSSSPKLNTIKCHSEVWEQSWLEKKDIEVSCQNDNQRVKRHLTGGETTQSPTDPEYKALAEESLLKYVHDSGTQQNLKVVQVEKVTTQVVAGSLTRIDFVVSSNPESNTIKCHSEVWERPWLNKKDIEVSCQNDNQRVKRQLPGGQTTQAATDPKYKALAEESLLKYVHDSGTQQNLKVVQVEKVTTQVVAGTLTRIDFVVSSSPELNTIKCHSEVWEQSWLEKKDIEVSCQNDNQRVKRYLTGGETTQSPTDPEYKALAEESLLKYVHDSGTQQNLKVVQVEKVTTQVVAGTLTRIDFVVSGSPESNTIKCHSEVWERPWLNKKDIEVSCQNDNQRVKRQLPGGQTTQAATDPKYKALAEESLLKYVHDSGTQQNLKVVQVEKVTTQVVAGTLTRIDFVVSGSPESNTIKCHSEVWERPWLNKKDIEVSCQNDNQRVKRQLPGGQTTQAATDPKYKALAEESLLKYVHDSGTQQNLKVVQVEKVTTQVVAGTLTRIDFVVSGSPESNTIKCHSEVWERPWLNKKDIEVSCQNDNQRVKRQLPGGQTTQAATDPKYKALAEESLLKYVHDSGTQQNLKVVQVEKVTTQVVAGTLTRIDFVVSGSPESNTIKCHSEVWERPWLNKKDIEVSCQNDNQRVKRQLPGGQTTQAATDPKYKALAEESLLKYVHDSGTQQNLKVVQVEKVTTQVVAGTLTRIDFVVSGSPESNTIKCHSEVWERPWLNKKDIEVSCQNDNQRVKRQLPGGQTTQAATDPKYKALAEESLLKYVHDSGTQQNLKVVQVEKVTTQVVAGSLTRIDFVVSGSPESNTIKCHSAVWERPWLDKKDINVSCQNDNQRVKRHLTGGETTQSPTDPEYKVLAEESLQKYIHDSGTQQALKVVRVEKVTTQVVAGTLTRIDFVVSSSPELNTIKCHSEVWEQSWLEKKDIEVSCQNDNQRVKRHLTGGETTQSPTDPEYKALAEESLLKYVHDSGTQQNLKVVQVEKVTTQVVAGTLTRIDFVVSGSPESNTIKCHSEVWERPWLNKKDIEVSCQNDNQRVKRQLPGGQTTQAATDPKYKALAEESLLKYVHDSGTQQNLKVVQVEKVTTQVVAGTLTRIDFVVSGSPESNTIKCHSEVWERPWLNKKDIEVSCQNDNQRVKRQLPGGQTTQAATDPKYKALAEESLLKYVHDSGTQQNLKVVQVEKVTTQVVAGTLTRIDFVVSGSPESNTIKCHSEVWERPWLNKKDIEVSCQNDNQRVKRQLPGGQTTQAATDPKYKALAEESLLKYVHDSGTQQNLKVVQVEKVTTQVVAGSLTRIDFVVSGSPESNTIKCHSAVWERPWLDKKDINVSCQNDNQRVKRHLTGGETTQSPTDPEYKVLAEESLQKYIHDSGTQQALKVVRVEKVTTQVVAGTLTRIDFVVSSSPELNTIKCHSEVWEQSWLGKKDIEVSCQNDNQRVKRQLPGGQTTQASTDPKYKALAEESLLKYVHDSGTQQNLKVVQVEKVTTQVVAGTLTRIDFVVSGSPESNTIKCHSEVWEQSWLEKKDIEVSCQNDNQRVKRYLTGGETTQSPTDPEYKALAEESLQKYIHDSGTQQTLKVVRVEKVTTQVVAGTLTRIDFVVSSSPKLNTIKCHSEVWEQSWLEKKDIEVSCQNDNQRVKRHLTGGETTQSPTDPEYKALAEESLLKYVHDSGTQQNLKVVQVEKVTTQVVAGSLTRIDFVVSSNPESNTIKCHSEVWERPWLNKKDIEVSCQNDNQRVKRQLPGGQTTQAATDPKYKALAEESLLKYVHDSGTQQNLKVVQVEKVTTQVVAGTLTRIDFVVSSSPELNTIKCHSEVWEQSWLEKKDIEVSCQNDNQRVKRYLTGGETTQSPTDPEYKALAEESLQKYVHDSGTQQTLKVVRVEKVTTQVVAGTLTRIDFVVSSSPELNTIKCHSEVWEQSWLEKKDIEVSCQNDNQRVKRYLTGGETTQSPTDPEYKALAEESLLKYVHDSGTQQNLKVVQVEKVTTQVVAGTLTRIDFVVSSSPESNTIKCHSEVWERPWLDKKDINVSCQNDKQRGKRDIDLLGGQTTQAATDPKYKVLAEESMKKYLESSGNSHPHRVLRVVKVTTKVVSGKKTSIDFTVAPSDYSNNIILYCHSEIWEQAWLNKKDISVACNNNAESSRMRRELVKGKRNKERQLHGGIFRGQSEEQQDPNKEEYKLLAEESLRKYQQKSTIYHKVVEVKRVVTRVVSGFKYKIDFSAVPTECSANVSNVHARSCKAKDAVLLYCHTEIWDRPWLKLKKIDIQCYSPNDDSFEEVESDFEAADSSLKPTDLNNNYDKKYKLLAEEASEKYLTISNRKYVHKVTDIQSVSENITDGTITKIEYSISPTTCLRNETRGSIVTCDIKQPLIVLHCNAKIWDRPWLHIEKDIRVNCKKMSRSNKRKREAGVRTVRQIGDDDEVIDEDTTYYYADRAVQHVNDQSNSNNLHKLVTIHAVQNSVQMKTTMVRMYIEIAETYCLRHHTSVNLHDCEEMDGLDHRLCLARLWPSPDDELVVRHVSVVCDDDQEFASITALNIPELLRISIRALEKSSNNKFKLVHQGEPQVIPSLDSKIPIKLNFIIATTNCSKDVNLNRNPFQCYVDTTIPSKACHSFIWLVAQTRTIRYLEAKCANLIRNKRSLLDPANVTKDNLEIQKLVTASLEKLEMRSLHRYKQRILQINSHSTKITSGKVTTIDFDVGYTSCLKYEWVENITSCDFIEHLPRRRCVAQIWERLWINNGQNIDVNCVDDETPLESHIEFESAEMANQLAREALRHIEAKYPHPRKQTVVRIFSLEKQVVAGIHYRMKVEVGFTDCLALSEQTDCKLIRDLYMNKFCRINVWVRPWTDHPPNFRVSCDYQEGATHDMYHHVQAEHLFINFITTYNPSYANDYSQMHKRFEIFKTNIKKIHEFNVHEKGTARYGVTRFTDLTYEEFSSRYMGLNTTLRDANQVPMKKADIPDIKVPQSFDWREYDAVTEVKDQGSCGSCWAFSVTGNIEGQWKMQSGQLVSLSEQELVDCDKLDDGCNGGLPDNAYRAIEQLGGLELEIDYPYEADDEKCEFNKTLAKVQITGAVNITANETGMAQWLVHNGPISIGINANAMQFYMGGISHPWKMLCNPTNLDHGVLIVGYGVKEYPLFHKTLPYWIVKNSWGKSWGEQGYYRVYRGDGTCGVNQMASSAVI